MVVEVAVGSHMRTTGSVRHWDTLFQVVEGRDMGVGTSIETEGLRGPRPPGPLRNREKGWPWRIKQRGHRSAN
jgi:hypothetical protein